LDWQRKKEKSKAGRPGKVGYNMKILKKNWILILALLAVVALILFNLPGLKAWRLRALAAEQIKSYVDLLESSSPDSTEGFFYCLLPLFHEGSQPPTALNHATQWLEQAQRLDPKNSHGNFLLGQAYCLKQEFQPAIDAFDGFLAKRPENQLAKAETGFAAVALARLNSDPQTAQISTLKGQQFLEEAGFTNDAFIMLGDESFKREKYKDALVWYLFVSSDRMPTSIDNYRLSLLEAIYLGHAVNTEFLPLGSVTQLGNLTTLEPDAFFYIIDATPASVPQKGQKPISVLWSRSSDIGAIIVATDSGNYCLELEALDKKPEPTELELRLDFETILKFVLTEGDGQWKKFETEAMLEQGAHLLSVELLNDYHVDGVVDRNGYIGILTIQICQ
jgi:cytochrome c-type biogenesis protein CcmH/NrfG